MKTSAIILFSSFLMLFAGLNTLAQENNVYNVTTAKIAAGDGVTDERQELNTLANVTLALKGGEIYFPNSSNAAQTDYLISSNMSFPRNVQLRFAPGARLKIAAGVTVTLADAPAVGRQQIFNLQGNGKVLFGTQVKALPQWWGAIDNADNISQGTVIGTDSTAAIQAALSALGASGGGILDVSTKNGFILNGSLNMQEIFNVKILGNAGILGSRSGGINLVFTGAQENLISAGYIFNVTFERVGFFATNAAFKGNILYVWDGKIGDPQNNVITGCSFSGRGFEYGYQPTGNSGVKIRHGINIKIEDSGFYNLKYGITNDEYVNIVKVTGNVFVYTESYGIYLTGGVESWSIRNNTFEGGNGNAVGKQITRALKVVGSAWSIDFSNNWLGDGTKATEADPMVAFYSVYGLTIDNNRFANYGGTAAYGILLDGCVSVTVRSNRFEYMPPIGSTITKGYTYVAVFEGNNWNGGKNNFDGIIGTTQIDGDNNFFGSGLVVNGKSGPDSVGIGTSSIGFGTVYRSIYEGQERKYGGGIRMTSALLPYNDGSMIFTLRQDLPAQFSFWNDTEILRMDKNEISAFKQLNLSGGMKIAGPIALSRTMTAAGVTGDQTINKINGRVNLAAGAASITVINSLVEAGSSVIAVAQANDTACSVKNVVPGAGRLTINMTARCAAETPVAFWVFN